MECSEAGDDSIKSTTHGTRRVASINMEENTTNISSSHFQHSYNKNNTCNKLRNSDLNPANKGTNQSNVAKPIAIANITTSTIGGRNTPTTFGPMSQIATFVVCDEKW